MLLWLRLSWSEGAKRGTEGRLMAMTQTEIVRKTETAATVFRGLAWLVALVGVVWAASWVWFGFTATEPWIYGGILIEEDWESIAIGFLGAAITLVYTALAWAVATLLAGVAGYVGAKAARGA